jgi:hypothetical protein
MEAVVEHGLYDLLHLRAYFGERGKDEGYISIQLREVLHGTLVHSYFVSSSSLPRDIYYI